MNASPSNPDLEPLPFMAAVSSGVMHDMANILTAVGTALYQVETLVGEEVSEANPGMRLLRESISRLFVLNRSASEFQREITGHGIAFPLEDALRILTKGEGNLSRADMPADCQVRVEPGWLAFIAAQIGAPGMAVREVHADPQKATVTVRLEPGRGIPAGALLEDSVMSDKLMFTIARRFASWMGGSLKPSGTAWMMQFALCK